MGEGCPPLWVNGRDRVDCLFPSDHAGKHGADVVIDTQYVDAELEVYSEAGSGSDVMDAWISVWIEWEDGLMPPSSVFPSSVLQGGAK